MPYGMVYNMLYMLIYSKVYVKVYVMIYIYVYSMIYDMVYTESYLNSLLNRHSWYYGTSAGVGIGRSCNNALMSAASSPGKLSHKLASGSLLPAPSPPPAQPVGGA